MSKKNKNYSTLVSQNIKHWREVCGLSQELLGKMIGVSESAISLYENGKREPDIETLGKLAETFYIQISDLFREPGKKGEDEVKEARVKAASAIHSIRIAIEHIMYKIASSHFVLEDDVNILEELIHIWHFAEEAENDIDGVFSSKRRWVIDNLKVLKLLHEKKTPLNELADHLNIPVRSAELMLHGLTPITLDTSVRIALFLNCQIEDIIRYTGEENNTDEESSLEEVSEGVSEK